MYLQKLEIQGFKSFAHKVTLTFNQGITAVVGPNGSGKSNVSDAIRWVLGEQSMKLLRGKKAEDVIFAGSDKKNRLGSAEVSVFFNNEDGRAPIDASEFVITRRVFRTGESEYLLNNRPTRLTDIALLLAKSNFGQRSYSIIGQGMIDEVLSATPAGRKIFFDEAAGVRAFQIKKEQAEHKLMQTKENLERVDLLVQEIEPRLRSLTRQVKRLEQRSEVETQLRLKQDAYYRSLWHEVQKELNEEKSKHNVSEKEKIKLENERDRILSDLGKEESVKTRDQEFERLERSYQKLTEEKNRLLRERSGLEGKRDADLSKSGNANIVWLEKKLQSLDQKKFEIEELLDDISRDEKKISESLALLEQERAVLAKDQEAREFRLKELREATQQHISIPELSMHLEELFRDHEQLLGKLKQADSLDHLQSLHKAYTDFHARLEKVIHEIRAQKGEHAAHDIANEEKELQRIIQRREMHAQKMHEVASEERVLAERRSHYEDEIEEVTQEQAGVKRELEQAKASGGDREDVFEGHRKELDQAIQSIETEIEKVRQAIQTFNEQEQKKKDTLVALQKSYAQVGQAISEIVRTMNQHAVEIARLETRTEDLEREMSQELTAEAIEHIKMTDPEPVNRNEMYGDILRLKKQMELIGGIDEQVTEEYHQTKQRHDFLSGQLEDLNKAVADLEQAINELDETIKSRFDEAFQRINKEFGTTFKKLFGGGKASLELIKEDKPDPDADAEEDEDADADESQEEQEEETSRTSQRKEKIITGVAIYATPPGKKLKSVGALSGGERALTSIALISAIIANNPSPFVVLDEVDAALDEANSERFAMILAQLVKNTQFITITHNRATMEHASILYGVTMGDDGISKLLSVNIENAEEIISRTGNR